MFEGTATLMVSNYHKNRKRKEVRSSVKKVTCVKGDLLCIMNTLWSHLHFLSPSFSLTGLFE